MKKCIKCNKKLGDNLFPKRINNCGNICKNCTNMYQREHYIKNKVRYIKKSKISREKSNKRNIKFLINYCKKNPCVDCGEDNFIVLHFDHVRGKKYKEISRMVCGSLEKLKEEVLKCDVRCANCHMKKTAKQFSYYKYIN